MEMTELKNSLQKQLNTPLIALAVCLLLLIVLASSTWTAVQGLWLAKPPAISSFRPVSQINIKQLPQLHLMGSYAENLRDLPLASLGVTLQGIFSNEQGVSSVLIALSGGSSQVYHVGDKLSPNVTIEKILAKSVVVRHNGRLEKLQLPIQPLKFDNKLPQTTLFKS